jgi:hypothetical protein
LPSRHAAEARGLDWHHRCWHPRVDVDVDDGEAHDHDVAARVSPLTGLPTDEATAASLLVVKIDNFPTEARLQSALNQADVVFGELVEELRGPPRLPERKL